MTNEEEDQEMEEAAKKDADADPKVGSYQNRVKRQAHKKAQNFIREKLHQKSSIYYDHKDKEESTLQKTANSHNQKQDQAKQQPVKPVQYTAPAYSPETQSHPQLKKDNSTGNLHTQKLNPPQTSKTKQFQVEANKFTKIGKSLT